MTRRKYGKHKVLMKRTDKEFKKAWEEVAKKEEENWEKMTEAEDKKLRAYEKALGLLETKDSGKRKGLDEKMKYDKAFEKMEENLWKNQNKALLRLVK